MRRGKGKKSPETVGRTSFIENLDGLLAAAGDPKSSLETAAENAALVKKRIAATEAGTLVVQPPLSHEQTVSYLSQATTIGNLAQTGLTMLEQSAETREAIAAPAPSGTGSEAKA